MNVHYKGAMHKVGNFKHTLDMFINIYNYKSMLICCNGMTEFLGNINYLKRILKYEVLYFK